METYAQLQTLPDDEIIRRLDASGVHVQFGATQYLELLARRQAERQAKTLTRLTQFIGLLTFANVAFVAVDLLTHH